MHVPKKCSEEFSLGIDTIDLGCPHMLLHDGDHWHRFVDAAYQSAGPHIAIIEGPVSIGRAPVFSSSRDE